MSKVEFTVVYPWGSNFVQELGNALAELGFAVIDDESLEGSDGSGLLACKQEDEDKAVEAMAEWAAAWENDAEEEIDEADKKFDEACKKFPNVHISMDWKDFDYEHEAKELKSELGLTLTCDEQTVEVKHGNDPSSALKWFADQGLEMPDGLAEQIAESGSNIVYFCVLEK